MVGQRIGYIRVSTLDQHTPQRAQAPARLLPCTSQECLTQKNLRMTRDDMISRSSLTRARDELYHRIDDGSRCAMNVLAPPSLLTIFDEERQRCGTNLEAVRSASSRTAFVVSPCNLYLYVYRGHAAQGIRADQSLRPCYGGGILR